MSRFTVGTALYLAAAAGIGAAVVAVLLAPAWSRVWHTPDAAFLIALWAPGVLLATLSGIPIGLLRRRLRFASAAGIESVSPLIGFAIGGALVLILESPSALVLGQVATAAAMLGIGLLVVRSELNLRFSRTEARTLLSFSGQVSAQNLAHYGFYTLPGLVIARTAGSVSLGFFSRAYLLVMLPMNFLTLGISKSIYPAIPRLTNPEVRRRALSEVVAVGAFVVWPLLGLLAGSASLVVDLLLGPDWGPSAAMVAPLCLFAAANLQYVILSNAIESIGWLRVGWMIQGAWAFALGLTTIVAWQLDADVLTYLYVYAFTQVAIHILQVIVLSKRELVQLRRVALDEVVGGTMALFAFVAALAVSESVDGSLFIRLAATGAVVLGVGITMLVTLPRVAAGRALARRGLLPGTRPVSADVA
jgi:PST family polysaccharide transporter